MLSLFDYLKFFKSDEQFPKNFSTQLGYPFIKNIKKKYHD
jgi:hypothetical protein